MSELSAWLADHGLEDVFSSLKENGIALRSDLKDLGVTDLEVPPALG